MKRLVVFWTLNEMSASVAARGIYGPPKKYKTTPMRTDFDPETKPEDAIKEIVEKYGEKPPQLNPLAPSTQLEHQFAEIRYYRVSEVVDRPTEAVDILFQPELFPEFEQK